MAMMRVIVLIAITLLSAGWRLGTVGSASNPPAAYVGPCDIVSCAVAYSLTRSMTASYSGPLFQLTISGTFLDIGQTANRVADMTTWSAFCGGVASNCKVSKIYDQIHNATMVPATVSPFLPACNSVGNLVCAAPFTIEGATGLPILVTATSPASEYYNGNGTLGADDTPVAALHANATPVTLIYNGKFMNETGICCGQFGISHKATSADIVTTAMHLGIIFGNTSSLPADRCTTSTTICLSSDEESQGTTGADLGTTLKSIVYALASSPINNLIVGTQNGNAYFNQAPFSQPLQPGDLLQTNNGATFIRVGGGGDMAQPAAASMREALASNFAIASADQVAVFVNMQNFYNTLTFP